MTLMALIAAMVAWIALVPTLVVVLRLRSSTWPAEAAVARPAPSPCRAGGRRRLGAGRVPRRVG
jgi:hypothetical protein